MIELSPVSMACSESSSTASSQQSESTSSQADRFPRSAGEPINDGRSDNGPIPHQAALSVNHDLSSPQTGTYESLVNDNQTQRQNPPADSTFVAMVNGNQQSNNLSRQKSQFYSEVFAYREPNFSARDKIHQFSIITVEVKTNVIVSPLCSTTREACELI